MREMNEASLERVLEIAVRNVVLMSAPRRTIRKVRSSVGQLMEPQRNPDENRLREKFA
jgi:hypothetical protein